MPDGGGGGGGVTETRSTTTQQMSPEQRRLFELVIPKAETFINQDIQQFPGSAIAGFNPLQQAGQQMTVNAAQGLVPQVGQAQNASQFLLGPVLFPESNPALAAATEAAIRPLVQQFQQQIIPNIGREAVSAGQFGGTRQGIAEGIAGQELIAQSGDITSRIASEAFQNSLSAMTQTLGLQPALFQSSLLPGAATEAVGSQQRGLEQARLSESANRFMQEQILPFLQAQQVAGLASGIPGGTTTTTGTGTAPGLQGPSPLQMLLSGLSIAGLFA